MYKASHPNADQLAKINRYVPDGMPSLNADEVYTISIRVADNLLNRSYGKWRVMDLHKMADLIVGVPTTLDHDAESVAKAWGRVYDARVVSSTSAPGGVELMAGNGSLNQGIVAMEGYQEMVADAYFDAKSPIFDDFRFGRYSEVSLGGFRISDMVCPLCMDSFFGDKCPHYIPGSYSSMWADSEDEIAPYYIRTGLFDVMELSCVLTPNLPGAGVLRNQ